MLISDETRVFTHPHPVRANDIDSTVLVPITEEVYVDHYDYEKIPALAVGENLYRLQASPLVVRDLNLDDIVMADDNGMFIKLEKDNGKHGFRVAMQIHYDDHDDLVKYEKVMARLEKLNCDMEFYSHQLVGIVASSRWNVRKLNRELIKLQAEDLILGVETNRI